MRTTRKKTIKGKIFTKENIRSLWRVIKNEYDRSQEEQNHSSLELEIKCVDGISYESETDDLLQDGDIIDNKKCTAVSIEYHDYGLEERIGLNLVHGDAYGSSDLIVRGEKNWASGTFETLNDIIESVKPQGHWFVKYKTLILHVGALLLGFVVYTLLDLWYQHIPPVENPSENLQVIRDFVHKYLVAFYLLRALFFWLLGIFPIWWLRDWILKLWPSIEFDFGPEHEKTEKIQRQKLGLFFSIIFIPFFLNLIYDLLIK